MTLGELIIKIGADTEGIRMEPEDVKRCYADMLKAFPEEKNLRMEIPPSAYKQAHKMFAKAYGEFFDENQD